MIRLPGLALLLLAGTASAQKNLDKIINEKEVARIEKVLSADELMGRRPFTPGIEKAADFIAAEFKAAGLQTFSGSSFRQTFSIVRPKQISASATVNAIQLTPQQFVVVTSQPDLKVDAASNYNKIRIAAGANLFSEARRLAGAGKNMLILVDTSFSKNFGSLAGLKRNLIKSEYNVVFILTQEDPVTYLIEAKHEIPEPQSLSNVVGILPGKSKKDEYVIFSGHYDHLGIGKPVDGDSIYNGANDDAAGTTAVMMLAKYFSSIKDNERTLVFAAFTAEESGGFGATYFSRQFDPAKVMAMFNIEMIGTESKWGKNSAFITGYEKTDMGTILEKNLEGTGFKFYPDPYIELDLFYRSDNATLARLGVPAHTISTSKMDAEPNYHKPSDEFETLDMKNMAEIIRAIALSSRTIVSGKETPSRVNTSSLK
ncbi:MAG: M28 family peptidase [Gemmatimonadaceae bacterium]|nr:M28 family peptidase [Chitinophagaceae bacterium]